MKLNIEIVLRDNEGPLNERCKEVTFSDEWATMTLEERLYFYDLVKADLDFAAELDNEEKRTG